MTKLILSDSWTSTHTLSCPLSRNDRFRESCWISVAPSASDSVNSKYFLSKVEVMLPNKSVSEVLGWLERVQSFWLHVEKFVASICWWFDQWSWWWMSKRCFVQWQGWCWIKKWEFVGDRCDVCWAGEHWRNYSKGRVVRRKRCTLALLLSGRINGMGRCIHNQADIAPFSCSALTGQREMCIAKKIQKGTNWKIRAHSSRPRWILQIIDINLIWAWLLPIINISWALLSPNVDMFMSPLPLCLAVCSIGTTDFEQSAFNGWTQPRNDQFDWTRRRGATPSTNTGPSADHTLGTTAGQLVFLFALLLAQPFTLLWPALWGNMIIVFSRWNTSQIALKSKKLKVVLVQCASKVFVAAGIYAYIETSSPVGLGDNAVLRSPLFSAVDNSCSMTFWYHMYGATTGTLNVKVNSLTLSSTTTVWTKKGNQGNKWSRATAPLQPSNGQFYVSLERF